VSPRAFATEVTRLLAASFSKEGPISAKVRYSRRTAHSLVVVTELLSGKLRKVLIVKAPRTGRLESDLVHVLAVYKTAGHLRESGIAGKVRLQECLGVLPSVRANIFEFVDGVPLSVRLERTWLRDEQDSITLDSERLGEWLRRFHDVFRKTTTATHDLFPDYIRPYQSFNCEGVSISQALRSAGVPAKEADKFVLLSAGAVENLPPSLVAPTLTYGDFRIWNVVSTKTGPCIIDCPASLCFDRPLRDVCAFLTSLDIVLSRPFGRISLLKDVGEEVRRRFLQGYLIGERADWRSVAILSIVALLASLRDLQRPRTFRETATKSWLLRKLRISVRESLNPG